jgi:hypothetical protein
MQIDTNNQLGGLPANKLMPEQFINSAEAWRQYNSGVGYYDSSAIPVEYKPVSYSPVLTYGRFSKIPQMEYDPGTNNNYLVQKQITKSLYSKFMNKWIFNDHPEIFRYVKNIKGKDSSSVFDKKIQYIEEEIFPIEKARKILKRIMEENDLKWYELPYFESLVSKTFAHYIIKKLKKGKRGSDDD